MRGGIQQRSYARGNTTEKLCEGEYNREVMRGGIQQRSYARGKTTEKLCEGVYNREVMRGEIQQRSYARGNTTEKLCEGEYNREVMRGGIQQRSYARGKTTEKLCEGENNREVMRGGKQQRSYARGNTTEKLCEGEYNREVMRGGIQQRSYARGNTTEKLCEGEYNREVMRGKKINKINQVLEDEISSPPSPSRLIWVPIYYLFSSLGPPHPLMWQLGGGGVGGARGVAITPLPYATAWGQVVWPSHPSLMQQLGSKRCGHHTSLMWQLGSKGCGHHTPPLCDSLRARGVVTTPPLCGSLRARGVLTLWTPLQQLSSYLSFQVCRRIKQPCTRRIQGTLRNSLHLTVNLKITTAVKVGVNEISLAPPLFGREGDRGEEGLKK